MNIEQILTSMKRKILLLISASIALSYSTQAQIQSDFYENVVPEVSSAGTLGTYGQTPIDYYTGTPNISVPIFTLKSRHLALPISLNYDAKGVKVNVANGYYGQNWDMSAECYVVRNMHGLPDELPNIGYLDNATSTNNFAISGMDFIAWINSYEEKTEDTQPDEFVVKLPGRVIKFVLDQDGDPHIIPHANVKIDYTLQNNKINSFTIRLEDGTKYVFGQISNAIEDTESTTTGTKYHWESSDDTFRFFNRTTFNNHTELFYPVNFYETEESLNTFRENSGFHAFDERHLEKKWDGPTPTVDIDPYNSKWYLIKMEDTYNDYIEFEYETDKTEVFDYPKRTTEIKPLLSYTEADVLLLEQSREIGFQGSFVAYNDNGDGFGTQLVDLNVIGQPSSYVNGALQENWLYLDQAGYRRSYKFIDNVGVRAVAKFASTDRDSAPTSDDPRDAIIQDLGLQQLPPPTLIYPFDYQVRDAFDYEEVYPNDGGGVNSFTTITTNRKRLKTVTAKSGAKVDLVYNNKGLSSIKLTNNENDFISSFMLEYINYTDTDRIFLDQVYQQNEMGASLPGYEFNYYKPFDLPAKESSEGNKYGFKKINDISGTCGTLEKVTYPTGGYTEYDFNYFFGNQLSNVKNFSASGELLSHKHLNYDDFALVQEAAGTTYQNVSIRGTSHFIKYEITTNFAQNPMLTTKGSYVGYTAVTEQSLDKNGVSLGKTIYEYTSPETSTGSFPSANEGQEITESAGGTYTIPETDIFPFPVPRNKEYMQGLLLKKEVYDANDLKVSKETFSYSLNPHGHNPEKIKGFIGGKFDREVPQTKVYWYGGVDQSYTLYRYGNITYQSDWVVLDQKVMKQYQQGNDAKAITVTTDYEYRSDGDNNMIKETNVHSDGTVQETRINYPGDYCPQLEPAFAVAHTSGQMEEALMHMCDENNISQPIEVINIVDGNVVSSTLSKFFLHNNIPLIQEINKLEIETPITYNSSFDSYVSVETNPTITDFHMHADYNKVVDLSYNNHGHLTSATATDGTTNSYTYGYNSTLMTSKTTENQTTTYEHKPLVGITKVTDPNGKIMSYEYDDFNRLSLIKDENGDILERYRYKFSLETMKSNYDIESCLVKDESITFDNGRNYQGVTKYIWDFGDGTVLETTTSSVAHTYSNTGTYETSLTLLNAEYATKQTNKSITILSPATHYDISGSEPSEGEFHFSAVKPAGEGYCGEVTYQWEKSVNNGVSWASFGGNSNQADLATPWETQIRLLVTDDKGTIIASTITINQGEGHP